MTMLVGSVPSSALAAGGGVTLEFRPHCTALQGSNDDWALGPIPSPGIVIDTLNEDTVRCTNFEVLDPQTVKTPALREGDILDVDLVIQNPKEVEISRVRAWLSYDPNILEGQSLAINDVDFATVTPGESDFDSTEGYAKMESSTDSSGVSDSAILFARLQFRVKKTVAGGSPISFHDVQSGGHTMVLTNQGGQEQDVLSEEPGVLQVVFAGNTAVEKTPVETTAATESSAAADPNACIKNEDCESGLCIGGQCAETVSLLHEGDACTFNEQCESEVCAGGLCGSTIIAETDTTGSSSSLVGQVIERSAFALIQVKNLRVTTEGSSVFAAWDPLATSSLAQYNVYFGRTSGRYINRKTVDASEHSITIRTLPQGERYFFAVRAVSKEGEESAFSKEVAVTVGDPSSSTAPLTPGSFPATQKNPVKDMGTGTGKGVPGETGLSSTLLFFVLLSAVIGTIFASRRQFVVRSTGPTI